MIFNLLREATADPNDFDQNGKIQTLEDAFKDNPVALKVAYMIATSHEYDKPNVQAALSLVKNYDWEESNMKVEDIEGINKPVNKEKVFEIATSIKADGENKYPLAVVDKIHGVTPQSPGKQICIDGHHRKESLNFIGYKTTPIYKGTYNGNAEKSTEELAMLEGYTEKFQLNESSSKKKIKIEKVSLTPAEREAVEKKYGKVECSFHKNSVNGKYFCTTHRARSKFYDSPTDIPMDEVKFISSTS